MELAAVLALLALSIVLVYFAGATLHHLAHDLARTAHAPHWHAAYDERGRLLDEDLAAAPPAERR